jgi:hypothetical protein
MICKIRLLLILTTLTSLFGCTGTIKMIDKFRTQEGTIRFYVDKKEKNKPDVKGLYASVNNKGTRIYYRFCDNEIVMTTEKAKQLTYTVYHGQLPINYDSNIYKTYSHLDLVVLTRGDKLLDSLRLDNFKRTLGSEAYQIDVNYYHGYPKRKRFRLENCR